MDPLSIVIAVSIAIFVYAVTGLSPGGIIVPLYMGYFFSQPRLILTFFILAFLTYGLLQGLERIWILYGRQRFAVAILLSTILQWGFLYLSPGYIPLTFGAIGLLIPGIFAAELYRQGVLETTLLFLLTSGMIHLALRMMGGGWF